MHIKNFKQETPIVLAFTANYLVPASTCLLSILASSPSNKNFHVVCLVAEPLAPRMQELLRNLDTKRLRFSFVNLDGKLNEIYVDQRYTVAASYRLLLPELLPGYDKVIYLDCDMIVRQDLSELYENEDLGSNYIAAVFEATLPFQTGYLESIGIRPGHYINSGFLLMNLALLRKDQMVPKFLSAAKQERLQFPDQDVLNMLCQGRIKGLPPVYNGLRTFFLPQYKEAFVKRYSETDWRKVQQEGSIHYTGGKPWNGYTVAFEVWWKYFRKLPKEIQGLLLPSKRVHILSEVYSVRVFRQFLEAVQTVYRKIRYRI